MKEKNSFLADLLASVVVFLIALPLSMGIAIASGVPAEKGIVTAILGAFIVTSFSSSPLQVSGPAASLAVLVWSVIESVGPHGLVIVVIGMGLIQMLSGFAGLGSIFRSVSPTVILALLSGIGALILLSQIHVLLDLSPKSGGLQNLLAFPGAVADVLKSGKTSALFLGLTTIGLIVGWERFRPARLKLVPGALVGICAASLMALLFKLDVKYVQIPANILDSFSLVFLESFEVFSTKYTAESSHLETIFEYGGFMIAMALVGSAETLMCTSAIDKMTEGFPRPKYNKELIAQGLANTVAGLIGTLPMAGVIVRSCANVDAGAKTRRSVFLLGVWLFLVVAIVPQLLAIIPTSGLAALLVLVGYRLLNPSVVREQMVKGPWELGIFLVTLIGVIGFDLLTGILAGLLTAFTQLLVRLTHFQVYIDPADEEGEYVMELYGAASFLRLPKLEEALETLPDNAKLHVHLDHLRYIDHACLELLTEWGDEHEANGGIVYLEWDALHHYMNKTSAERNR